MPNARHEVLQLKVTLADVTPPVWRRLLVPEHLSLAQLHDILQAAMGWEDSHLHAFDVEGTTYGPLDDDDADEDELDEQDISVGGALASSGRLTYQYDFGDSWEHEVVVEARSTTPVKMSFAKCVDGENACPPEDSGGAFGYAAMLKAVADPSHEDHADYVQWLGEDFDPTAFDVATVNAALQQLR